ncbi:MAG: PIN domain-containing protein [Syntrophobacteraceae bacterium]|jgi:predicted nucleic acid-binding protein
MIVFADTSALFALLVRDDYMHVRARVNFEHFVENNTLLLTSSYVLIETLTLLQRRVTLEAVWDFNRKIMPILDVVWVDERWHTQAMQRLHVEGSRSVSLTDCLSFEIMDVREITTAFTFDNNFTERGFEMAAFHDLDAVRNGGGNPTGP